MESPKSWEQKDIKYFDKKTGQEILTKPPHNGFQWREGYILRRTKNAKSGPHGGAIVGGDAFDWVPQNEIEIEKSE